MHIVRTKDLETFLQNFKFDNQAHILNAASLQTLKNDSGHSPLTGKNSCK
jgi:hypothetical protein